MDLANDTIRGVIEEVGRNIRVRAMNAPVMQINSAYRTGKAVTLTAKAYPYPPGHLARAMALKALELVSAHKPLTKPPMTVVLGILLTCTEEEFYLAFEEDN